MRPTNWSHPSRAAHIIHLSLGKPALTGTPVQELNIHQSLSSNSALATLPYSKSQDLLAL